MRWPLWQWIEYLMHPASKVYIKLIDNHVAILSGEGTELFTNIKPKVI